jgi:hypothetical protein
MSLGDSLPTRYRPRANHPAFLLKLLYAHGMFT